jgi:hypothetical protein
MPKRRKCPIKIDVNLDLAAIIVAIIALLT